MRYKSDWSVISYSFFYNLFFVLTGYDVYARVCLLCDVIKIYYFHWVKTLNILNCGLLTIHYLLNGKTFLGTILAKLSKNGCELYFIRWRIYKIRNYTGRLEEWRLDFDSVFSDPTIIKTKIRSYNATIEAEVRRSSRRWRVCSNAS